MKLPLIHVKSMGLNSVLQHLPFYLYANMITLYQTGTTSHNKQLQLVLWFINRNWTCTIEYVFCNAALKIIQLIPSQH